MDLDSSPAELLARARRGDPTAFETLIRPHLPAVRRFTYAFTRHWEDADDLAQEALLKAFRSLHGFEGRSSLTTWLFTITRSVCHDFHRSRAAKERRTEDELPNESPGATPSPGELLDAKRRTELLWEAIRRLEPEFRTPVVLFDIEGLPYEDIAKIEGIPVGTVRSRLSRARQRLREMIAPVPAAGTESVPSPSNLASEHAR